MHSFSFHRNSLTLTLTNVLCIYINIYIIVFFFKSYAGWRRDLEAPILQTVEWILYELHDRGKTASSLNTQSTSMGHGGDQPFKSNVLIVRHIRCYQTLLNQKNKDQFFSFFVIVADKRIPIVCHAYTLISSVDPQKCLLSFSFKYLGCLFCMPIAYSFLWYTAKTQPSGMSNWILHAEMYLITRQACFCSISYCAIHWCF